MTEARRGPEPPDISEKGGMKDGQPQRSNVRLFMQFMAFGGCADTAPLGDTLARAKISGVLYEDVNDPRGAGLLTFNEDPDFFLDRVRPVLNGPGFSTLIQKKEYTMLGRTYAIGYEPDLPEILLHRPRRTVLNPASAKVTVYVPGRRSTMLYRPSPSVTAVRTFSMSAGLEASTITPGSTAPDASLTSPETLPVVTACARATVGRRVNTQRTTRRTTPSRLIGILLNW